MNTKRLLLCLVAAFVTVFVTDYLIHQILLAPDYAASKALWRSEETMQQFLHWLMIGELLWVLGVTLLWVKGFAERACWTCVLGFGFSTGLVGTVYVPTFYAVMPLPGALCVKWFVAGLLQSLLVTLVLHLITKRKAA